MRTVLRISITRAPDSGSTRSMARQCSTGRAALKVSQRAIVGTTEGRCPGLPRGRAEARRRWGRARRTGCRPARAPPVRPLAGERPPESCRRSRGTAARMVGPSRTPVSTCRRSCRWNGRLIIPRAVVTRLERKGYRMRSTSSGAKFVAGSSPRISMKPANWNMPWPSTTSAPRGGRSSLASPLGRSCPRKSRPYVPPRPGVPVHRQDCEVLKGDLRDNQVRQIGCVFAAIPYDPLSEMWRLTLSLANYRASQIRSPEPASARIGGPYRSRNLSERRPCLPDCGRNHTDAKRGLRFRLASIRSHHGVDRSA